MEEKKQLVKYENGVTYFDKRVERLVFFILTMAMLGWGVVEYVKSSIS